MKEDHLLHIIPFKHDVSSIERPRRFTFPFYYTPHPLAVLAAEQLQSYLETLEIDHNFGLDVSKKGLSIGKMFGVLVIEQSDGSLGYIAAFSGKLAESNHHPYFVPPIYDTLDRTGFYKDGEDILNTYNAKIKALEEQHEYTLARQRLEANKALFQELSQHRRAFNKAKKNARKKVRNELAEDPVILQHLAQESIRDSYFLKDLDRQWKEKIVALQHVVDSYETTINEWKEKRKSLSNELQNRLFDQYQFLNIHNIERGLRSIFADTVQQIPPAGAGECAAPKLLQFAFAHHLKPLALAEFWWGASPKSEIRKHKHYYPACKGKCEPILGHMLKGMNIDPNPLESLPLEEKEIQILYEDEHMLAINKPHEFLSVPGKSIKDSVQTRMKTLYPNATGPLVVHRLDMSTSGVLLIAKDLKSYHLLQQQFIKKTIQKRYIAILNGVIAQDRGRIELPMCLDFYDRPRQMVSYEHGKEASTAFQKIEVNNEKTRVYFFPITGRTHQLRVHAAHTDGLNAPILGDDLYGIKKNRLYLHAERITFKHPYSGDSMTIVARCPF